MIFGYPLLSVVIWLPIVFGGLVLATGNDRNAGMARWLALLGALLGLLVALPLYTGFDRMTSAMQFVELNPGSASSTSTTTSAWTAFRCCSSCSIVFSP